MRPGRRPASAQNGGVVAGSDSPLHLGNDPMRHTPVATPGGGGPPGAQPLLDELLERSPIGIAVIDGDGDYRSVNPAYCAIYGYRRDELIGRSFTIVLPADQHAAMLERHRRFVAGVGELRGEWDVVRRDGVALSVMSESVRVPGEDGRARRLVYVVDITQRRQMERALRSSQQFAQSVLDGLTSQVCVLDEAGVIVAVNRAWREFAAANGGASDRTGVGGDYLGACERLQDRRAAGRPLAPSFSEQLREVLAGERQQFELEYDCHSPSAQRWFMARVARIAGSDPPRIVVEHDDVTALKQAQERLRQSEALMLDLAASIPGAAFRLARRANGDWRPVYVSPGIAALFETGPSVALPGPDAPWGPIVPEDRAAQESSLQQAIANGGPWQHEFRIRTRDGRLKWIHARANLKPGDDGEVIWTGVLTDISERKHIEAELREREEIYRNLFETVPQGVVYHDRHGHITSANPAAQRILGRTPEQLQAMLTGDWRWQAIREDGSDLPAEMYPPVVALRTGQGVHDVVLGVAVPGRGRVWLRVTANPILRDGVVDGVYTIFQDISQRVLMSRELERQAGTDYLTGVANRRRFMARLAIEFERIARHPELRCSVLELDLDHFKRVNDSFGHAAGDAVLVHVTQLMQQETRVLDLFGRIGGEEFMILLPDTDPQEAMELAERLRRRVERTPVVHEGRAIGVTASIGVSAILPADASAEAVLARVDRALYEAKNAWRNTVRLYRATV